MNKVVKRKCTPGCDLIASTGAMFPMVIVLFVSLIVVGCGEIGMLVSETQSFTGKDSITLQTSRPDILDVSAEVGKSLGYNVSGLDREDGVLTLASSTSLLTGVLIGQINQSTLTISSQEGGKKLGIGVLVAGNFGTGGQEAAMKLVNDFKTKLLSRIGQPSGLQTNRIGVRREY